jgi:hypothetical protein
VSECFERTDEVQANIVVKGVPFLHPNLDVPGPNLGPETGHSERFLVISFSSSRQYSNNFL